MRIWGEVWRFGLGISGIGSVYLLSEVQKFGRRVPRNMDNICICIYIYIYTRINISQTRLKNTGRVLHRKSRAVFLARALWAFFDT